MAIDENGPDGGLMIRLIIKNIRLPIMAMEEAAV